jgi:hypothetical protein
MPSQVIRLHNASRNTPVSADAAPVFPVNLKSTDKIGDNDVDMSVFQQPWWLEAVSDNRYRTVRAGDGNAFLWWPYLEQRWLNMVVIGAPPMTHTLGPVIRLSPGKAVSQASQRRKLIENAIGQFPEAAGIQQVLGPNAAPALDYQLAGFEQSVRYTYRLDTRAPIDDLWNGLKDKARNTVRRARQSYAVMGGMTLMDFYDLYEKNLGQLGRRNHHDEGVYRRLSEALSRRERHQILTATDRVTGLVTAAVLLIWDATSLYYFRATQDPGSGDKNASSLLVWEAIVLAKSMGLTFDSDSFMGRAGAMFIEAFGAVPVERMVIARRSTLLKAAQALSNRLPVPTPRLG